MAFSGKVVLVTGASSGIGAVAAVEFAKLGASVVLTGRSEENLKKVADDIAKSSKSKCLIIPADLANDSDVPKIIEATINEFGKLDVLINNAGFEKFDSIEKADVNVLNSIFQVNVRAVYQLTALAVPHLVKSKGTIVNVSSVVGLTVVPAVTSYCMSKAALDQFTKCIALELAPKGVRVNSVNPGYILTPFHRRTGAFRKPGDEETENRRQATLHALGRTGNTEEVVKAIIFLAGDESSFTTGALLPVDGGRYLMCPR